MFEPGPRDKSPQSDDSKTERNDASAENPPNESPGEAERPVSGESEPIELQDSDFVTPIPREASEDSAMVHRPERPVRRPGPGLGEALAWTFGVLVVHFIAGMATFIVILFGHVATHSGMNELQRIAGSPKRLESFFQDYIVAITCGEMGLFVLAALLFTGARLGRQTFRALNFSPIPVSHIGLILCIVLPLSLVCGQLHWWSMQVWEQIVNMFPDLSGFQNIDVNNVITSIARESSLPLLILMIAVAPAIGEELVFRGIVGRGLTARWGLVSGIAGTSILFAIVHGHPAHAFALLPLAVFIHVLYYATRSFWAPMLLHFLNNAWAVTAAKYAAEVNVEGLGDDEPVPALVVAAGAICIAAIAACLWRTRVEYRLEDGTAWNPGYPTVEAPPTEIRAFRTRRPFDIRCFAASMIGILLFIAAFVYSAIPEPPLK